MFAKPNLYRIGLSSLFGRRCKLKRYKLSEAASYLIVTDFSDLRFARIGQNSLGLAKVESNDSQSRHVKVSRWLRFVGIGRRNGFRSAWASPYKSIGANTMFSTNRKQHAKRQLDESIHQLTGSLTHARQPFWRLLQIVRGSSTLLRPVLNVKTGDPTNQGRILHACKRLAEYSQHWKRSPEEWIVPSASQAVQFRSLVSHLFDAYPIPKFMARIWLDEQLKPWELNMYLHLAGGRSIRQFELPVPFRLTKIAAMYFMQAPDDLVPMAAVQWARIRSWGSSSLLARRLVKETVLADPTAHEPFWESVIRFLKVNQPISDDEAIAIVNFIHDQRFKPASTVWGPGDWKSGTGSQPLQPEFTVRHRTLRSLRRHMMNWRSELAGNLPLPLVVRKCAWERSSISPLRHQRGTFLWTIDELLTHGDLSIEGRIMNHCVERYVHTCLCRKSSIWSMKIHESERSKRVLTIEVNTKSKAIRQARGRHNAFPDHEATEVLRHWAMVEGLRCTYLR